MKSDVSVWCQKLTCSWVTRVLQDKRGSHQEIMPIYAERTYRAQAHTPRAGGGEGGEEEGPSWLLSACHPQGLYCTDLAGHDLSLESPEDDSPREVKDALWSPAFPCGLRLLNWLMDFSKETVEMRFSSGSSRVAIHFFPIRCFPSWN